MKYFRELTKEFKSKKDIEQKLDFYQNFIEQKLSENDLLSALNKCQSALTLRRENKDFGFGTYVKRFNELNELINQKILEFRNSYEVKLLNMNYITLTSENLEEVLKKFVNIKNQILKEKSKALLEDINQRINFILDYIKKSYELLGIYDILNYNQVIETTSSLILKAKSDNLDIFRTFFEKLQSELVKKKVNEIGASSDIISLYDLSKKCLINEYELEKIIKTMIKEKDSWIRVYIKETKTVIFEE
ncbi:hypothetical protein ES702_06270 [subsurface metagenome]